MMRMTFNTGRMYARNGQEIQAIARDGRILFRDVSRMIAGEVKTTIEPESLEQLRALVMAGYDQVGGYRDVTYSEFEKVWYAD